MMERLIRILQLSNLLRESLESDSHWLMYHMKMRPVALVCIFSCSLLPAACGKPTWMDPGLSKGPMARPFSVPDARARPRQVNAIDPDIQISPDGTPQTPPWALRMIGKPLNSFFSQRGTCIGNTDLVVLKYQGKPQGVKVLGWGWDIGARRRISHILAADSQMKIVGAGAGGVPRPDVVVARPEINDINVGWYGYTSNSSGVVKFFGVLGNSVCEIGSVSLR